MDLDLLSGSINPKNAIDCLLYKHDFRKSNPEYFDPEGLLVFCGGQGSRQNSIRCTICKKVM